MNIGVGGASGQLGQAVVRELLTRNTGHKIIAISRTPEMAVEGVEGRHGDYNHPESLLTAYEGLDRLLLIPGNDMQPGARGKQNLPAIDAAINAGVKHIVFMSATGTREVTDPAIIGQSYWAGEQALIKSAPRWTILRMNYYAETFAQEAAMFAPGGTLSGVAENRVAFVSREDVAAAAAGILIGEGHSGAIYTATGPKALSGAERAALVSEAMGTPVSFQVQSAEQLKGGMIQARWPEMVANAIIHIQEDFAAGGFDIVTGDVERLGGRPPRSLENILAA